MARNGATLLDVGASDGLFLDYLGFRSGVGLNILQECASQIRAQNYRVCMGDLENLPFQSRSFDYIVCFETLEHVSNPVGSLKEMGRVCRQRVFLSIPQVPITRINALSSNKPPGAEHIFEFCEVDFRKVVTHSNLRIVHGEEIKVFPGVGNVLEEVLLRKYFYPGYFRKLQYYELEPIEVLQEQP